MVDIFLIRELITPILPRGNHYGIYLFYIYICLCILLCVCVYVCPVCTKGMPVFVLPEKGMHASPCLLGSPKSTSCWVIICDQVRNLEMDDRCVYLKSNATTCESECKSRWKLILKHSPACATPNFSPRIAWKFPARCIGKSSSLIRFTPSSQ